MVAAPRIRPAQQSRQRLRGFSFALVFLAVSLLVTACQHVELTPQGSSDSETNRADSCGAVTSQQPIGSNTFQHFLGTPTPAEEAADKELLCHIVGTWTSLEDPRWAPYHTLSVQPDGSFTAIRTNRTKLACAGTWFVERGFLLLVKSNDSSLNYFGFHKIYHVDDHELVCGVGLSVAGRLRFTK